MVPRSMVTGASTRPTARQAVVAEWRDEAVEHIQRISLESRPPSIQDLDPVSSAVEVSGCDYAVEMANAGFPQPCIFTTRRGTIQFEWERGSWSLEIEVRDDHSADWLYTDDAAHIEEAGALSSAADLAATAVYVRQVYELRN